ncbi:hypothetical protein J5N97_017183 [Dioscorea zingiberensis]|uniref:SLC26A/SulP transporter domain-containing protein n=1 Tax=Dioscorea zingiberensis TaxID=325984 RepID=A0A9D5CMS7_9LILI|nr:hypothetical protein J5N97_017183 [Dioscorea zingiberensis]
MERVEKRHDQLKRKEDGEFETRSGGEDEDGGEDEKGFCKRDQIIEDIGNSNLANLEPQFGIYSSSVPTLVYAVMGSSRGY